MVGNLYLSLKFTMNLKTALKKERSNSKIAFFIKYLYI